MAVVISPISPVALSMFGLDVRWYALAYIAAFVIGYFMFKRLNPLPKKQLDDLLTYVILGTIIGGRLGYVLFYNLSYFLAHPLEIFAVWNGGMAFHGGLAGVVVAVFLYKLADIRAKSEDNKTTSSLCALRSSLSILDVMAVIAPIGLFFGRIANFINMEVMGRITDKPWGVVFDGYDAAPRHPSPLYEAALEGVLLFAIMLSLRRFTKLRQHAGALSGAFAMLYAAFRIFAEQFRAPDAQIGFLFGTNWITMGGVLSSAMLALGAVLFAFAFRKK